VSEKLAEEKKILLPENGVFDEIDLI